MNIHSIITRLISTSGAFVLLIAVLAIPTLGQSNKGEVKGTVTDQSGAAVQNAEVTITNTGTGATRTVNTGDDGRYDAALLDPGIYRVEVIPPAALNLQKAIQPSVTVQTAQTVPLDITLTAGSVGAEVTISTGASLVETETSDRGSVVTGREIVELPLSGRNFTQLATLTPGVVRANNVGLGGGPEARSFNNGDPRAGSGGPGSSNANGSSESSRFNRSGGAAISANGQRSTNNNFSLDGVDNNEPQFGTIGVFPNPDAIAEFKVTTSIPPAEVGRAAGAVINTTTKSGTNGFHGSLYYYGQNSALNAYHPKLKTDRAAAISRGVTNLAPFNKTVQQIHEFGATIGS